MPVWHMCGTPLCGLLMRVACCGAERGVPLRPSSLSCCVASVHHAVVCAGREHDRALVLVRVVWLQAVLHGTACVCRMSAPDAFMLHQHNASGGVLSEVGPSVGGVWSVGCQLAAFAVTIYKVVLVAAY